MGESNNRRFLCCLAVSINFRERASWCCLCASLAHDVLRRSCVCVHTKKRDHFSQSPPTNETIFLHCHTVTIYKLCTRKHRRTLACGVMSFVGCVRAKVPVAEVAAARTSSPNHLSWRVRGIMPKRCTCGHQPQMHPDTNVTTWSRVHYSRDSPDTNIVIRTIVSAAFCTVTQHPQTNKQTHQPTRANEHRFQYPSNVEHTQDDLDGVLSPKRRTVRKGACVHVPHQLDMHIWFCVRARLRVLLAKYWRCSIRSERLASTDGTFDRVDCVVCGHHRTKSPIWSVFAVFSIHWWATY